MVFLAARKCVLVVNADSCHRGVFFTNNLLVRRPDMGILQVCGFIKSLLFTVLGRKLIKLRSIATALAAKGGFSRS
jgi:hypothetical protein